MSTSLHSKKKEARKIEPPQINNECIKKALIQLTGAVMEVGYLLKCILVLLVFLVKILVMYFHVPKKSMMKKRYVFAKKNVRGRDASARSAHDHRI